MKKFLLLPALALLLTGCANDKFDNDINGNGPKDEATVRSFLSVSLVSPRSALSRDGETIDPNFPYIDGKDTENAINMVRFFFFNKTGEPVEVNKQSSTNTYLSYIDWIPSENDITDVPVPGQTVEKIAVATLGINQPAETGERPALILAVINPTGAVRQDFETNPSLTDIRGYVEDYYTGLTNNNFVMSNSVYAGTEGKIDATEIAEKNFQPTPEEASEPGNQLVIYVERVLARVDLSIGISGAIVNLTNNKVYMYRVNTTDYTINGSTTENNETTATQTDQPIYVQFLGWNVTSVPSKSRLVKDINPSWEESLFEATKIIPWNDPTYKRSYWAINPQSTQFEYLYGSFEGNPDPENGNHYPALTYSIPDPGASTTAYMQENAADFEQSESGTGAVEPNKVIIAAQLVNEGGNPLTLIHWANRYYTEDGVLLAAANTLNLYQKTTTGTSTEYTRITPDCLQILPADEVTGLIPPGDQSDNQAEDIPPYYVYIQLSETGKNITWYNGNSETATELTLSEANNYILDRVNYMYMWNSGYTYYYFDIRHLGTEGNPGYYGVVRNHIYKANVKTLKGLGTPVYDPGKVIIPEKPGYDDSVISAQVEVLQWRVVSENYDLTWP